MKLKFKKQKIASLHLIELLKGGNTYTDTNPNTQPPSGGETNLEVCNFSEQVECTTSLDPRDCHTNDATLKTWNQQTHVDQEGSQYVYCQRQ